MRASSAVVHGNRVWLGGISSCSNARRISSIASAKSAARRINASPASDRNSQLAHQQLLEKAKIGGIDIYFEGDSITRRWGTSDDQYRKSAGQLEQEFLRLERGRFRLGRGPHQNILWRLENGELDGVNPKIIVLLAGINNVGNEPGDDAKVEDITRGTEGDCRPLPAQSAGGHDHRDGHFSAQRQLGRHAHDQQDQRQPRQICRRQKNSLSQRQRQAGRPDGKLHDGMMNVGQTASQRRGLPGLGGWIEADLHGTARAARRDRSRPAANWRSERGRQTKPGAVAVISNPPCFSR